MFLSLQIDFVLANSADPDEMQHSAAFHLDLFCFCKITHLGDSILQRVNEICSISSGSSLFCKITHLGVSILQRVNEFCSISSGSSLFCKITHLGVSILQRVNEFCSISSESSLFCKITHLGFSILQRVNELLLISTPSFILFAYDKVIYIEDFIYSIAKEKHIFQTFILP